MSEGFVAHDPAYQQQPDCALGLCCQRSSPRGISFLVVPFPRELLSKLLWHWLGAGKYSELWKVPGLPVCLSGQISFNDSDWAGEGAGVCFP